MIIGGTGVATVAVVILAGAFAGCVLALVITHLLRSYGDLGATSRRARELGVVLCDYIDDASLLTVAAAYGLRVSSTDVEEATERMGKFGIGVGSATAERAANVRRLHRYTLATDRNMLVDATLARLERASVVVALDDLLAGEREVPVALIKRIEATVPLLLVSGRWSVRPSADRISLDLLALHNSHGRDETFKIPPFELSCEFQPDGLTQRGRGRFARPGQLLLVVLGTPTSGGPVADTLAIVPVGIFQRTYSGVASRRTSALLPPLGVDDELAR